MGISGLLPLLKSIQVNKHLSDLSGQALGIDAYVWLHRGTYGCATELATGKPTTKYVDFAMQRVRLLRHHGIEPYLVFDGGPLPAKKGTEVERRTRRADNLSRGKAFTARGQHTQARECYVKAIDVTPAMAYQLIKALKAENVSYVVAPYEADAQLAYLERNGLIDGIITEDSDLLVFGCKRVYYKLDTVSGTLVSISRDEFTSIDGSPQCNGISLVAWSDAHFRAMAILSGCDYLPSIPGIGLKTAWSALKKYKSVENVIRSIRLEGKKTVPHDYLANYKMAEMCFLHQRVYDPRSEKLVHLTPLDQELDGLTNAYVGKELSDDIARGIALGDIDPVTLEPILDINPSHQPKSLRIKPLSLATANQKGKGKAQAESCPKGLLEFFSRRDSSATPSRGKNTLAGLESGKRKLTDVHTRQASPNKRRKSDGPPERLRASRYFSSPVSRKQRPPEDEVILISSDTEKENLFMDPDTSGASAVAVAALDSLPAWPMDEEDEDVVTQEDGYLSADSWDAPLLSSPSRKSPKAADLSDSDPISSPPHHPQYKSRSSLYTQNLLSPTRRRERTVTHEEEIDEIQEADRLPDSSARVQLIDLTDLFEEDAGRAQTASASASCRTPRAVDELSDLDDVDDEEPSMQERQQAVGRGWRERWACASVPPPRRAAPPYVTPRGGRSTNRIEFEGSQSAPSSTRSRIKSRPATDLDSPWSRAIPPRTVKTR